MFYDLVLIGFYNTVLELRNEGVMILLLGKLWFYYWKEFTILIFWRDMILWLEGFCDWFMILKSLMAFLLILNSGLKGCILIHYMFMWLQVYSSIGSFVHVKTMYWKCVNIWFRMDIHWIACIITRYWDRTRMVDIWLWGLRLEVCVLC